jgi:TetR/AcrR family hemagglutinin/protease transcriptional regulator
LPPLDALIDLGRAFAEGEKAKPDVIRVWLDWSTGVGFSSWPNYLQALDHFPRAAEEILLEGKRQGIVPDT